MKTKKFQSHLKKLKEQKIEILEGTVLTSIQGGGCTKCKPNNSGGVNCGRYKERNNMFEEFD